MPNLTEKQKNRMIAAADIVEHGDLAVLQKILEFQDFLEKYQIEEGQMSAILSKVEEMKAYCESCVSGMSGDMSKHMQDMGYMMNDLELKLKEQINQSDKTTLGQIKDLSQRLTGEINALKQSIPTMPDLSALEAKLSQVEASIPVIKEQIKPTAEETRNLLESIKNEEEKLSIMAIGDLRKELDALKKEMVSIPRGGRSSAPRTGGVAFEKLNSQLNGVLKTFYIPNLRDVVAVIGSSFPNAFASVDDYTVGAKSITFTSAIEAGTTLAAGQTVIVIYNQLHYT